MNIMEFSEKLIYLMDVEGITKEDILNSLKIDYIKQGLWLNASSFPNAEERKQLSELFGIEESFLTDTSEDRKTVRITRSIRGTSDWYFKFIGTEFTFIREDSNGVWVFNIDKDESYVRKGDYIIVFDEVRK